MTLIKLAQFYLWMSHATSQTRFCAYIAYEGQLAGEPFPVKMSLPGKYTAIVIQYSFHMVLFL